MTEQNSATLLRNVKEDELPLLEGQHKAASAIKKISSMCSCDSQI